VTITFLECARVSPRSPYIPTLTHRRHRGQTRVGRARARRCPPSWLRRQKGTKWTARTNAPTRETPAANKPAPQRTNRHANPPNLYTNRAKILLSCTKRRQHALPSNPQPTDRPTNRTQVRPDRPINRTLLPEFPRPVRMRRFRPTRKSPAALRHDVYERRYERECAHRAHRTDRKRARARRQLTMSTDSLAGRIAPNLHRVRLANAQVSVLPVLLRPNQGTICRSPAFFWR
jgi:hypothetical protein